MRSNGKVEILSQSTRNRNPALRPNSMRKFFACVMILEIVKPKEPGLLVSSAFVNNLNDLYRHWLSRVPGYTRG